MAYKREVTNMKIFTNTFRMADKTQLTNMKANRSTKKQHFDQLYTIFTINNINIKINLSINLNTAVLSKYGKQYSGNNCPSYRIIVIQLKLIMARLPQALPLNRQEIVPILQSEEEDHF